MDPNFNNFGGQGSQSQPSFGPDHWAYNFATTGTTFSDNNSQQYNFVMRSQPRMSPPLPEALSQIDSTDDHDVEEVPRPPAARKGKEKSVSQRGGNFSKEEDVVICSAFLNTSKDPIIGTNQTQGSYYKRMHDYYNAHKPEGCHRSHLAIQGRWGKIQRSVNKFCGFKTVVDRRNESGKNEQDRIDDAIKMYEASEPFPFLHCWKILKDERKWNERVLDHSTTGTAADASQASGVPLEVHSNSGINVDDRPEGRDSAKRRAKRDAESSSSTAVEVLQRLQDSREKSLMKEEVQLREILSRKDEKLNLQRQIVQLHMNGMEIKKELHEYKKQTREEHLQLRKKEAELQEKQVEAQLLTAEAGIMAIDLKKVAPHLKNYYLGMQKQIMTRRGFVPNEDDST